MEIKSSKAYQLFSPILGNRIINANKVEKLVKDINEGLNLLPYCPIIVFNQDNEYKIVDGQHRFTAAKTLNLPVYFVECEPMDLKNIARLNSRSDKWKNSDFLECYARLGISDYLILSDFLNKYKIIYSASVDLLMDGSAKNRGNAMDRFRDGEFKVNYLQEVSEIVDLTFDVFGRYKFWNDRLLITAVQEIKIVGLCDFERLKEKIKQAPNEMEKQSSWKNYVYNIERVYNFRNSKREAIF